METPPTTPIKSFGFKIIETESESKSKYLGDFSNPLNPELRTAAEFINGSSEIGKDQPIPFSDHKPATNSYPAYADTTSTAFYIPPLDDEEGPGEEDEEDPATCRLFEKTNAENSPLTPPTTPNTQSYRFEFCTPGLELSPCVLLGEGNAIEEDNLPTLSFPTLTKDQTFPHLITAKLKTRKHAPPPNGPETRCMPTDSRTSLHLGARHTSTLTLAKTQVTLAPAASSPVCCLWPLEHRRVCPSLGTLRGDVGFEGWGWKEREMDPRERALERRAFLVRKLMYYGMR